MSQSITRLKELLFDAEAERLAQLARQIESVAASESAGRVELRRLIDEIHARVGDGERLTTSVSEILSEALKRAEVSDHHNLSRNVAPLVVATIKAELKNSQDEMVEALYPITGRLVKAYVASAMKDLADEINRKLERNPLMLRLQSLATGRSVAELAMAGTQDFCVVELYLVRRGSGALIQRWPEGTEVANGREHAMSGILAAINEFATEAFQANDGALRNIDLGGETVYMRASPLYLLAARCSGCAPGRVETLIDEAFLAAVERQSDVGEQADAAHDASSLHALGSDLNRQIAAELAPMRRSGGMHLLKTLAAVLLMTLAGWLAYGWYGEFVSNRVMTAARSVVTNVPAMEGYPVDLGVALRGRQLTITGLAPSTDIKSAVMSNLHAALPQTAIEDRLAVVASERGPDLTPQITKVADEVSRIEGEIAMSDARRALAQTEVRLEASVHDLDSAATLSAEKAPAISEAKGSAQMVLGEVKALASKLSSDAGALNSARADIKTMAGRLLQVANAAVAIGDQPVVHASGASLDDPVEALAAQAQRLQTVASALLVTLAHKPEPVTPLPPAPAAEPSADEKLRAWARANAVFFAEGTAFRDEALTTRTLESGAALLKQVDVLLRVVGYTDESGGGQRNTALAQQRAEKVRQALIGLGVPENRVVAVGRRDARDISQANGADSPNRRAEFEVGFDGERR